MRKAYEIIATAWLMGALALTAHGASYFVASITSSKIRDNTVNILIVPGHEPHQGGAEYRNIKERDIVLMIAEELSALLEEDRKFNVVVSRDQNGWHPLLADYFDDQWDEIGEWKNKHQLETNRLIQEEKLELVEHVQHNSAAPDTATRLYGINKWANENDIDIALHLHINDTPTRKSSQPGPFTGYSIYIPERQYSNAAASKEIAEHVEQGIQRVMRVSSMPQESAGIIEDQELIAIGRFNTMDGASLLIEYGYIYETQLQSAESQRAFAKKVARATRDGLNGFFQSP